MKRGPVLLIAQSHVCSDILRDGRTVVSNDEALAIWLSGPTLPTKRRHRCSIGTDSGILGHLCFASLELERCFSGIGRTTSLIRGTSGYAIRIGCESVRFDSRFTSGVCRVASGLRDTVCFFGSVCRSTLVRNGTLCLKESANPNQNANYASSTTDLRGELPVHTTMPPRAPTP